MPKTKKNPKNKSPKGNAKRNQVMNAIRKVTRTSHVPRPPKLMTQGLSGCALKYALCISDPFNPGARDACIPTTPCVPTQKAMWTSRFSLNTGTGGFGFVQFTPCLASDGVVAFSTGATYTSGVALAALTATNTLQIGVNNVVNFGAPYTTAQLIAGAPGQTYNVTGRIVSFGAKITYVGTNLNESGMIWTYASPTHQNVSETTAYKTIDGLGNDTNARVCPVSRDNPCFLNTYSVTDNECNFPMQDDFANNGLAVYPYCNNNFTINGFNFTSNGCLVGSPVMCVGVTSGATVGGTFYVEVVTHAEYTGPLATSMLTPTVADPNGFNIVQSAAQLLPLIAQGEVPTKPRNNWERMKLALSQVFTELKPVAFQAAKNLAFSAGNVMLNSGFRMAATLL